MVSFLPIVIRGSLAYAVLDFSLKLNRELHHNNLAHLRNVMLEDKSIYMIFEYAEHDLLVCCLLICILVRCMVDLLTTSK